MGRMLEQPIFGRRLRELRLERGLSQAALAGHEISTGYLSRLESGARPPTDRVVAYLAERLGVPASTFAEVETGSLAHVLARVTSSPTGATRPPPPSRTPSPRPATTARRCAGRRCGC
ncbi:helix-turn-helix domain-containing protein [Streptomyces sp. SBR177]